jgi:HSP20 family protein
MLLSRFKKLLLILQMLRELLNGLSNLETNSSFAETIDAVINQKITKGTNWSPQLDVVDTKNNLYIYADIPGVTESSINVEFFNNQLTISGEKLKRYTSVASKKEIVYGKFIRKVSIPICVTSQSNVTVSYTNGVLLVQIDKKKENKNKFSVGVTTDENSDSRPISISHSVEGKE